MDAIKYLSQQHRKIETLFQQYESSKGDPRALFEQIERAIIVHAILEEMHVYPLLRERAVGGDELADHALEEHQQIEENLKRLESLKPDTKRFDTVLRKVIATVREHVREEEDDPGLFEMLKASLRPRELQELARVLQASEKVAPTRAHPSAPNRPPANKIMGLPFAAMDRVRDALTGRGKTPQR